MSEPSAGPEPDHPPSSSLPAAHRLVPSVYYGWVVMAGSFVISFMTVGVGFYGQTVFLDALIRENAWSKEAVSGAATLYFIVSGLAGIVVGRSVDRFGARGSLVFGALLMAGSLVWLGRIDRPVELFGVYAVLAVSFAMTAAVPLNAVLARWFVARRAFAMSLSQTGVSLGGIVLVPVLTLTIANRGFEVAMGLLAAAVVVLVVPIAIGVIRWDPSEFGLAADGVPADRASKESAFHWRARDAARTSTFVLISAAFSLILLCQTGLSVHVLHLLRDNMSVGAAASGVSLIPLGSIIGRLAIGQVADRLDKRKLASALFLTQSIAHWGLSLSTSPSALLGFTFLFGLTIGSVFMLQSLIVMDLFGVASFGSVFGLVNLVTSAGGGAGPWIVGVVAARAGGYSGSLQILAVSAAAAALTIRFVKPPHVPLPSRS